MFNHLSTQSNVPAQHCSAAADRSELWLAEFDDYMLNERGLSVATRRGRRSVISRFLSKMVAAGDSLTGLTIRDVDAFLQSLGEQQGGYSRASLQMVASCLRPFFRYGAIRGWCSTGLAEAIKSPRVYSLDSVPIGPSWEEVKRLLALTEGKKPTDIRARAILMLLAIYGLRAGEVKQLRLDDFDWNRELLLVSHSKSLRTRMFPLSRPVGDAVLLYIKQARPRTRHREVFLTLDGRPLKDIYTIVSRRLRRLQTDIPHHGPHALRHACATHLLAEGCSLKQIGDQLGHQDADSTRIYAKVDISGLRKVADVDLGGLL
jgi:site-specific recombinase XerD